MDRGSLVFWGFVGSKSLYLSFLFGGDWKFFIFLGFDYRRFGKTRGATRLGGWRRSAGAKERDAKELFSSRWMEIKTLPR